MLPSSKCPESLFAPMLVGLPAESLLGASQFRTGEAFGQ